MVSEGHVAGTCGSGIVSREAGVLWLSGGGVMSVYVGSLDTLC